MRIWLGASVLAFGIAGAASAQLVGGGLGAGVGASMGSTVGGVGAATGAAAGVSDGATVSDVTRAASDAGSATAGAPPASGKLVRVSAGTRVRATQGSRCTDDAETFDPYQGTDGYWYCERTSAAARAKVRAGGK